MFNINILPTIKKILFLISITLLSSTRLLASTQSSPFDSVYVHVATNLAGSDVVKAVKIADSLIYNTVDEKNLMKSYMLMASLKSQVGETAEALSNALKADSIANKQNYLDWKVRIGGFLSTTFRSVNLVEEAKKHLVAAEQSHRQIAPDSPSYFIIKSFLHQEKALYHLGAKGYREVMAEVEKSEEALSNVEKERILPIFRALNFQLLGACYLGLEQWDDAKKSYELGLAELGDEQTELKGFIYVGLAQIALQNLEYQASFSFLNYANVFIKSSDNFKLKSSLYKTWTDYFRKTRNKEKTLYYNQLYLDILSESSELTASVANQLLKDLYVVKDSKNQNIRSLMIVSIVLFLTILMVIMISFKNRRRTKIRYQELIYKIENNKALSPRVNGKTVNSLGSVGSSANTLNIPKETEERLLAELNRWEKSFFFINPEITLSTLSTDLKTNPKYLSYVINTHKKKDFNNYINGLRVEYVILKLKTDPKYLHFKIAAIAEEAGFSSHSKFGTIFKSITGLSPSVFIAHLKNDLHSSTTNLQ